MPSVRAASVLLALAVPLTAVAVPGQGLAAPAAAPDGDLLQVVTTGQAELPSGVYRLVATGYLAQFGVTAAGDVVSAVPSNRFGRPAPRSLDGDALVQLDAGYRHALALDDEGHVTAWGLVGDEDDSDPATVPDRIARLTLTQVAAGGDHDLGLTADGRVVGWGRDRQGLLDVPASLGSADVAAVDTGGLAAAARLADGTVVSWGAPGATPEEHASTSFAQVAVGGSDVVALTGDGHLVAWGGSGVSEIPAEVSSSTVEAFGVGDSTAAALLSDGEVVTWGPQSGEIDLPAFPAGAVPVDLQVDRYAAAAVVGAARPSSRPTITERPAPHAGLAELTADPGTWPELDSPVFGYTWLVDGEPVGNDGPTLTVPWKRLGSRVTVVVTASSGGRLGEAVAPAVRLTVPATSFALDAPASVRRGKQLRVATTGLAPNEPFTIVLGRAATATGTAGPDGTATGTVRVPASVEPGRYRVSVVGATEERSGSTRVKVVR